MPPGRRGVYRKPVAGVFLVMSEEAPLAGSRPMRERRTNLRLRKLIDDLQAADRENQDAIDTLASHVSLLAHDVEALKRSKV